MDPLQPDECFRQIRRDGLKAWTESIDYHRPTLGAIAMDRFKKYFGEGLNYRKLINQLTEVALCCKVLDSFLTLGLPSFA